MFNRVKTASDLNKDKIKINTLKANAVNKPTEISSDEIEPDDYTASYLAITKEKIKKLQEIRKEVATDEAKAVVDKEINTLREDYITVAVIRLVHTYKQKYLKVHEKDDPTGKNFDATKLLDRLNPYAAALYYNGGINMLANAHKEM
jgi:Fic family protein